ncbi:MAG: hypothetical protein V4561_12705 [Bacteroidota bacterium]
MKKLLVILISALFFLPTAKGQSSITETNRNSNINEDSLLITQKQSILRFGQRQEGICYVVNGVVYNDSLSAYKEKTWLSINDFRRKKYTEKDFQYSSFEHFLKTLPRLQQ